MKRLMVGAVAAVLMLGMPLGVRAHDAYDDSETHPLRLAAYAVHPAGEVLEWIVFRPFHFLVSHPQLERFFGHTPHENPFGNYPPYDPDAR